VAPSTAVGAPAAVATPTALTTPAPLDVQASVTPSASPTEVALGRAGGDLLAGVTPVVAVDGSATAQPFPTARPTLARTPRPNLTPILPVPYTRTPTPTPDPGLLDRILRELLDLVR
jgi:hypothetical protein